MPKIKMKLLSELKKVLIETYKTPDIKLKKGETLEIEKGLFKTKIKITKK